MILRLQREEFFLSYTARLFAFVALTRPHLDLSTCQSETLYLTSDRLTLVQFLPERIMYSILDGIRFPGFFHGKPPTCALGQ